MFFGLNLTEHEQTLGFMILAYFLESLHPGFSWTYAGKSFQIEY